MVRGAPELLVRRIGTDSRQIQPGDLFVALPGERFDGGDQRGLRGSCGPRARAA